MFNDVDRAECEAEVSVFNIFGSNADVCKRDLEFQAVVIFELLEFALPILLDSAAFVGACEPTENGGLGVLIFARAITLDGCVPLNTADRSRCLILGEPDQGSVACIRLSECVGRVVRRVVDSVFADVEILVVKCKIEIFCEVCVGVVFSELFAADDTATELVFVCLICCPCFAFFNAAEQRFACFIDEIQITVDHDAGAALSQFNDTEFRVYECFGRLSGSGFFRLLFRFRLGFFGLIVFCFSICC